MNKSWTTFCCFLWIFHPIRGISYIPLLCAVFTAEILEGNEFLLHRSRRADHCSGYDDSLHLITLKIIKKYENISNLSPFIASHATVKIRRMKEWIDSQWWWTELGSCSTVSSSDIWWECIDRLRWQWAWKWRSTNWFPENEYFISSFFKGMSKLTYCSFFALFL